MDEIIQDDSWLKDDPEEEPDYDDPFYDAFNRD
jgi:hypothetical protein